MIHDAEWLAKHKGQFVRRVAYIWWCGDDHCDCHQPVIEDLFENKIVHGVVILPVWKGTFIGEPTTLEMQSLEEELRVAVAKNNADESNPKAEPLRRD